MAVLLIELIRTGMESGEATHTEAAHQLSMYMALCARSGGGKSVAAKILDEPGLFTRREGFKRNLIDEGADPYGMKIPGLASGQAMIDALTVEEIVERDGGGKPDKVLKIRHPAVLTIVEDELDNLAQKSSGGSILTNTILSAWSCNSIGDVSRTHGSRVIHGSEDPYSVFLFGGIQPARAATLVGRKATASGLAQRLFFLGTEDPWYADLDTGELRTDGAQISVPYENAPRDKDTGKLQLTAIPSGVEVRLSESARTALRVQNAHTAAGDQEAWETHLLRIRIRLACLMALHSGSDVVTEEIWEWSSWLMEHRRRAFAFVERGAEVAAQEEADEVGIRQARAKVTGQDAVNGDVERVALNLYTKLPLAGVIAGRELRQKISSRDRKYFKDAMAALKQDGVILETPGPNDGIHYGRLVR